MNTSGHVSMNVSDKQIEALRAEAAEASDDAQVRICDRALNGDKRAVYLCAVAIRDAKANAS